jgi:hypothetical protein
MSVGSHEGTKTRRKHEGGRRVHRRDAETQRKRKDFDWLEYDFFYSDSNPFFFQEN